MSEFNEFLIKMEEIKKNLVLILGFLFLMLPVIGITTIIETKKENKEKNKSKNDNEKDFTFINWILISIGLFVLLRSFVYF